MANGLYTRDEISRMTDDALDELLSYYGDTGNAEGVQRVTDEQGMRQDDLEAQQAEIEWEAEQDRQQRLHDEMIDDALARREDEGAQFGPAYNTPSLEDRGIELGSYAS